MLYLFWGARNRCSNPRDKAFKYYGARGIEFRFKSFEEFVEALGPWPGPGYSVDRKNNDGHYEPGNVKWSTKSEQMRNRRGVKLTVEAVLKIRKRVSAGESRGFLASEFGVVKKQIDRIVARRAWASI